MPDDTALTSRAKFQATTAQWYSLMSKKFESSLCAICQIAFKVVIVLLNMAWVSDRAVADMIDTKELSSWEVCAMCHGVEGVSAVSRFPNLAGQKQSYIIQQVQWFAKGYRINDGGQMKSTAASISFDHLQEAAMYYSGLSVPAAKSENDLSEKDQKIFAKGQQLYHIERGRSQACSACHDHEASDAPWLRGQHKSYLVKQIKEYIQQKRYSLESSKKIKFVHTDLEALSEESINAVAFYLSLSTK